MTTITKNEDGSLNYGDVQILAPLYNSSTKKYTFHIVKSGFVSAVHYGNHLTLKNSIKSLVEGMVPVENTEAPSEAPEAPEVYESTDPVIVALKASLASGTEEAYWEFKAILDRELQKNLSEIASF